MLIQVIRFAWPNTCAKKLDEVEIVTSGICPPLNQWPVVSDGFPVEP